MLTLLSLTAISAAIQRGSSQATVLSLPVTYYLPSLEEANSVNPNDAVYYFAKLCDAGLAGRTQAVLHIFEKDNPAWNTKNLPYVVAQVSVCENDFTDKCVIATNYQYTDGGSKVDALPSMNWTMGNETEYYIRAMGGFINSQFSMELSFVDGIQTPFSYPYSTDYPFKSTSFPSKTPVPMEQYWKTSVAAQVKNFPSPAAAFALAYCDQGKTITAINVAVSGVIERGEAVADYSLMQQWGCPQTIELEKCTQIAGGMSYWSNPAVSTFNLMTCDNQRADTRNGIWVKVEGAGANLDGMNTFVLNANTMST